MTLLEHEFDLDGYVFGIHNDITVESWNTGSTTPRTQDLDNPARDGRSFGVDYIAAPSWSFDLSADQQDTETALAALAAIRAAWRADSVRSTARAVSVLRYHLGGRTRKVFGRGRRFSAPPDNRLFAGYIPIVADFELVDARIFDDVEAELVVNVVPSAVGGLVTPLVTPLTTVASSVPLISAITITGSTAADVIVEIEGPITNPYVQVGDYLLQVNGSIDDGRTIRVDPRPWVNSVTWADTGGSAAGRLSARSKLSGLQLLPGAYPVTFGGQDATGTARARLRWTPAHDSI